MSKFRFIFTCAATATAGAFLSWGVLEAWLHVPNAHTLTHLGFGIGLPLFFVSLIVAPGRGWKMPLMIAIGDGMTRLVGDGIFLATMLTEYLSVRNEILDKPAHLAADWHHWLADNAGIAVACALVLYSRRKYDAPKLQEAKQ